MKSAEYTRSQIVAYVRQEMRMHGIHTWTMDDVAHGMRMSKRTIYQVFSTKRQLVETCLSLMSDDEHTRLSEQIMQMMSPVQILFHVVDSYINLLHSWGPALLADMAADSNYEMFLHREELFWQQQIQEPFQECHQQNLLVVHSEFELFARHLQTFLWEQALNGLPYDVQHLSGCALLRGLFRFEEIANIDKHVSLVAC